MKKLILILTLVSLSLFSFAQQDNKDKYKDYRACTECFDQWSSASGYDGSTSSFRSNNNSSQAHPIAGQATQETKKIIATVVGVFVTAISFLIYAKTQKAANGIQ